MAEYFKDPNQSCCEYILQEMVRVTQEGVAAFQNPPLVPNAYTEMPEQFPEMAEFLAEMLTVKQGFIQPPGSSEYVPTLGELLGRVQAPLGSSFGNFLYREQSDGNTVVLLTFTASETVPPMVSVNGVPIAPSHYTISGGNRIVFNQALQRGDIVGVKSYGG